jgi:hypothetical protein
MPKVITSDTLKVEGTLVIEVVGVELFTLTIIGFVAKLRVGMGTISYRALIIMELLSHISKALGWTWAIIQCITALSEFSSITTIVNMHRGSALG